MVLSLEVVNNNGSQTETGSATCTVSSGGNALQIEFLSNDFPDDPAYSNYTIAPDEFPCD